MVPTNAATRFVSSSRSSSSSVTTVTGTGATTAATSPSERPRSASASDFTDVLTAPPTSAESRDDTSVWKTISVPSASTTATSPSVSAGSAAASIRIADRSRSRSRTRQLARRAPVRYRPAHSPTRPIRVASSRRSAKKFTIGPTARITSTRIDIVMRNGLLVARSLNSRLASSATCLHAIHDPTASRNRSVRRGGSNMNRLTVPAAFASANRSAIGASPSTMRVRSTLAVDDGCARSLGNPGLAVDIDGEPPLRGFGS